jgi:predicted nucleic acid-binding protein
MGSLILPTAGLVYVDANAVIYSVEKHPVYGPLLEPVWQAARPGGVEVVSSELVLLETLVGPLKAGDSALATAYELLFQQPGTRLLPVTRPVLREAARLRAALPALRTPDALHAATALLSGCSAFVTNDPGFRRVPGLSVTVLKDLTGP